MRDQYGRDSAEYDSYWNDHKTKFYGGAALLGIGSAAAVTGAVLLIVDVFKHKDLTNHYTARAWELHPYFGTHESGLNLTYSF